MDEKTFDRIADDELHLLDKQLGDFDPDEVEAEMSAGVLTLTLGAGDKIIINSHRAAGEIWMAAFRQAWHFAPKDEGGAWKWRTATDELHAALGRVLSQKLGRPIALYVNCAGWENVLIENTNQWAESVSLGFLSL